MCIHIIITQNAKELPARHEPRTLLQAIYTPLFWVKVEGG